MRPILLQNATAILLQNATEVYYKMHQVFYYEMRQLLQNATILLQNATVVRKCDVYYKLRQYTLEGSTNSKPYWTYELIVFYL